jgi:hypothetical protein|tara:strand:- start:259 stop:720 length:462 start_codon:yes stop_codon:yes gene_type:complete
MIIKKLLPILVFVFLTSCGYQSIYSQKNLSNISITKIELVGDRTLNKSLLSQLVLEVDNDPNLNNVLVLNTKKEILSLSKDNAGNTKIYNTKITTTLSLKKNDKIIKKKTFVSNFDYSNIDNKFALQQYQRNIEQNLIKRISENILIFLISIK